MNRIYINGYGLNLAEITNSKELLELVGHNEKLQYYSVPDLEQLGSQRKYRRYDRFSLLIEKSMLSLFGGKSYEEDEQMSFRTGSVINTSYGCLDTNINFIDEINDSISQISPILFAHTVYNAALGHMCQNYKLRGPSTMVLSSNYIFIAMQMLKENRVKYCYAGGAEIYIKELYEYLKKKNIIFRECSCILKLCSEIEEDTIGEIVDFSECNFFGHPYIGDEEISKQKILQNIEGLLERNQLEAKDISFTVASSLYGSGYKEEEQAFSEKLKGVEAVSIINNIGETLGASLGVSILYAVEKLKLQGKEFALVNNFDIGGNYVTYLVKSVKKVDHNV